MKKITLRIFLLAGVIALSACTNVVTPSGLSSIPPGIFYTGMKFPSHVSYTVPESSQYEIVQHKVQGTSSQSSILLFATYGDGSLQAAKAEALKKIPGADDIINLNADTEAFSIFLFYINCKTIITGDAIKYTSNGKSEPSATVKQ